ncbi:hypothetical protein P3S67_028910 [Capsicum chacoense]
MAFVKPGDVSWTPLSCIRSHVDDATCHGGKFYAIDTFGEILIWDLAGSFLKRIAFMPSRGMDNLVYVTTYLVDIWCFKIYKLDVCNEKWEEVKSLGDWSIFVGSNRSFSISRAAYPECKSNCIYFTDDFSGVYYNAAFSYDMGIYNVQNGRYNLFLRKMYPILHSRCHFG